MNVELTRVALRFLAAGQDPLLAITKAEAATAAALLTRALDIAMAHGLAQEIEAQEEEDALEAELEARDAQIAAQREEDEEAARQEAEIEDREDLVET